MSPYFGWIGRYAGSISTSAVTYSSGREDICMTNMSVDLLKTLAAFAITATFSSVSFAGDFTVLKGQRYRATLSLGSVERLVDNDLVRRSPGRAP